MWLFYYSQINFNKTFVNSSEKNEKSGELCKYIGAAWWPLTSAGCEAVTTGARLLSSSRSPGSQFLSGAQTGDTWTRGSGLTSVSIIRQHWELLSLIYWEKIWAGPPGPVSPCHRQSVNTVLGSEEENLFYPPGRQCQCFHLDLSPQRDHLTKLLPFRSQIIWSAWIHKEGWVVHKVFNLPNNQVSTVIVWVRNSLTQRDKKLMFILSTLIAWHLFGTVQIFMIWELAYNSQKLTQILWPYQPQLHKSWTSLIFCSLIFNIIFRLLTRVQCPAWLWTWTGWGSVSGGGLWPPGSPCLGRSEAPPPGPRCPRSARMTRGRGRSHRGHQDRGQSRGRAIPRLRNWTQATSRGWRETGRQKSSSHQVSEQFEFIFLSKDLIEKMVVSNARYVGLSDHSDNIGPNPLWTQSVCLGWTLDRLNPIHSFLCRRKMRWM